MKKHLIFSLLLLGGLCCIPASAAPTPKAPAKSKPKALPLPVWEPDKELLKQLTAPISVGNYELRVPQGYALQREAGPAQSQIVAWAGPAREDGVRPYLMMVTIAIPPAEAKKYSPEQILDQFVNSIKQQRGSDWERSRSEHGTINGIHFVRATWSGSALDNPLKLHGFNYITVVGDQLIQLSSQDVEPNHEETLALARAATLTFKRTAVSKPPKTPEKRR